MYEPLESVIPKLQAEGFVVDDPWDVVDAFEAKVAAYAGSRYAVALDSCTNAMFLCLKYLGASGEITIPEKTYLSVPGLIIHAGCKPQFADIEWSGAYPLSPYPVIDGATRFTKGMYEPGTFHCLSFHIRKIVPIGKGGMILTDDEEARDWFDLAVYEGRNRRIDHDSIDDISILGWNMYMPPEQAARGIELFDRTAETNDDTGGSWKYADISGYSAWNQR